MVIKKRKGWARLVDHQEKEGNLEDKVAEMTGKDRTAVVNR